MSCESWKESIALDAGGNLSQTAGTDLARHLRDCPACRSYADEMAASQQALRRYSERPLEKTSLARIRSEVLKRLATQQPASRRLAFRRPAIRRTVRWLALAASLLVTISLWRIGFPQAPIDTTYQDDVQQDDVQQKAVQQDDVQQKAVHQEAVVRPFSGPPALPSPSELPEPGPRVTASKPVLSTRREPVKLTMSRPAQLELTSILSPSSSTRSDLLLDLTETPTVASGPVLRRLSERSDTTIYWLEEPADPLKENENADTKIL